MLICEQWIKATLSPFPIIPRFPKDLVWIEKTFIGAMQLDLLLYSAFISTKLRIGEYNKSILGGIFLKINKHESQAFTIPEYLILHAYGLFSIFLCEKILTQVFSFFKHLFTKFNY